MNRCFALVADDDYLIGCMTLIHSIRRFYIDIPIYVCLKLSDENVEIFNQFLKFYKNIIVTDPSAMPFFENGHMWTYKFQSLLECKEDIIFLLDVDQIMTFYVDDWFNIAEHGFMRICDGGCTIKDSIGKLTEIYPQYAGQHALGTASLCFDKAIHSKFLNKVLTNYTNPDIRREVYGDMGAFLVTLCEMDYFKNLHHENNTELVGTVWSDAQGTEYLKDKRLFIRKRNDTRGIISLVHYNGIKPWQAYKEHHWSDNTGFRQWNYDSLDIWCDLWDEVKHNTGINCL